MRVLASLGLALSLAALLPAQEAPGPRELAGMVQASRLSRTVDRLASFGTRHSLSDQLSDRRGIGAARRWLSGEMQALTRVPDSRLVAFEDPFHAGPGPLLPGGADLVNLGVLLPGTDPGRAREALVLAAHYDSRAATPWTPRPTPPERTTTPAGGGGAGDAAVLAATRPAISVYFVATAGGAQGSLAARAWCSGSRAKGPRSSAWRRWNPWATCSAPTAARTAAPCASSRRGAGPGERRPEEGARTPRHRERRRRAGTGALPETCRRPLRGRARLPGDAAPGPAGPGRRAGPVQPDGFPGAGHRAGGPLRAHEPGQGARPRQALRRHPTYFDAGYCARIAPDAGGRVPPAVLRPRGAQNVGLGGCGTSDARLWWTLPEDPRIAGVVLYRRRADGVQWQQTRGFVKSESR